jgi:diguanylate cyclase (GGDEF)-like protein
MAALYYFFGKFSLSFFTQHEPITISAFIPEGIALAGALIYGKRILPGIFIGQFLLLVDIGGMPMWSAIGISAVNTIEAYIAIMLFHYYRLDNSLHRLRDLIGLILLIVFVLQPFSAFFGNLSLAFAGATKFSDFWQNSFAWWFGNVIGQILFTPLLLLWYHRRQTLRLSDVILTILAFSLINVLFQYLFHVKDISLLLLTTLPLSIYVATRDLFFGALAALTVSVSSILLIHYDMGLFAKSSIMVDNVIDLNFFILSHIILTLTVGVLFREKEEAIQHLKSMVHYDYLTGLPNRHVLRERIHHAIFTAQKNHTLSAICFVDLDGFKQINDTFGHHIGDLLLVEVVKRLKRYLNDSDDMLRLGGDEFLIIFNRIDDIEALKKKLQQILDDIASNMRIEGYDIKISLSIGISLAPDEGTSVKELMEKADDAMYQAKKRGKNKYTFSVKEQQDLKSSDLLCQTVAITV